MEEIFTNVYENNLWGNNNNSEYSGSSGMDSDVNYNKDGYVPFLKTFIDSNNIKTVIDLGCGDFKCGNLIYNDLDILYTGYDVYKKLIDYNSTQYSLPKYSFIHLDLCNDKENIINGDMYILKDVIHYWSLDNIYTFLDYLIENKKFKYILICNNCNQTQDNTDIENGGMRDLNIYHLPLKKYNPVKLFNYYTKEVSIIKITASEVITSEITASVVMTSEVTPMEVIPTEVIASVVTPTVVTTSEVTTSEVTASEVNPTVVTSTEVTASEETKDDILNV